MSTIEEIVTEAAKFELEVYNLYKRFESAFPEDSGFWKEISDEEKEHAAILRRSLSFEDEKKETLNIVSSVDLESFRSVWHRLDNYKQDFEKNPTSETAYKISLKIESNIVELGYEKFMTSMPESNLKKVFQLMNGESKNHIERIKQYFRDKS